MAENEKNKYDLQMNDRPMNFRERIVDFFRRPKVVRKEKFQFKVKYNKHRLIAGLILIALSLFFIALLACPAEDVTLVGAADDVVMTTDRYVRSFFELIGDVGNMSLLGTTYQGMEGFAGLTAILLLSFAGLAIILGVLLILFDSKFLKNCVFIAPIFLGIFSIFCAIISLISASLTANDMTGSGVIDGIEVSITSTGLSTGGIVFLVFGVLTLALWATYRYRILEFIKEIKIYRTEG